MKNTKLFGLILSAIAMSFVMPTNTDGAPIPQDIPDAKTVIEKHIKALGGRAKLESVKTAFTSAAAVIAGPNGDMNAEVEVFQGQKKFLVETNISVAGNTMEIKQGSNGEVVWVQQPMLGYQVVEGADAAAAIETYGSVFPALTWNKYKGEIKNEGIEKVGDNECYKLVFKPKEGHKVTRFFDTTSSQIIKVETKQPGTKSDISYVLTDFKTIDGVVVPHKQVTNMAQGEMELVTKKVEFNKSIDDSKFALPEEVMAKAKKMKETMQQKTEADE